MKSPLFIHGQKKREIFLMVELSTKKESLTHQKFSPTMGLNLRHYDTM